MKIKEKGSDIIFYAIRVTKDMMVNPQPVLSWLKKYGGKLGGKLFLLREAFLVHGEVETVSGEELMYEEGGTVTIIERDSWFLVNEETTFSVADSELDSEYETCE